MLVDAVVKAGLLQFMFHCLGLGILLILLFSSHLSIVSGLILAGLLIAFDGWWLRQIILASRLKQIWQGDSKSWYWLQASAASRAHGQLIQIRHYGFAIYIKMQSKNQFQHLLIWRDQVNDEEWRKLSIQAHLNSSF